MEKSHTKDKRNAKVSDAGTVRNPKTNNRISDETELNNIGLFITERLAANRNSYGITIHSYGKESLC